MRQGEPLNIASMQQFTGLKEFVVRVFNFPCNQAAHKGGKQSRAAAGNFAIDALFNQHF